MRKPYRRLFLLLLLLPLVLVGSQVAMGQSPGALTACKDFAFSTEEDFLSHGPTPADGNPIISDGDLLSRSGAVCLRNRQILLPWEVQVDLGLDSVDVISVEKNLVSFSTELDDPFARFTAGDLLSTWGSAIPNRALLILFQVAPDRGLDAIQWIGGEDRIVAFHDFARTITREQWLANPSLFITELQRYQVDVWFSIEGTERHASTAPIYDGDLLSAATGVIILRNSDLLPPPAPAGLPARGVDFGLDGFAAPRNGERTDGLFTTEILYNGEPGFTDGDVLKVGNSVVIPDADLSNAFEPDADFLGVDALSRRFEETSRFDDFWPRILRLLQEVLP